MKIVINLGNFQYTCATCKRHLKIISVESERNNI